MWTILKTKIEGLLIIEPRIFSDDRGYFLETFNSDRFNQASGCNVSFVQDNESRSMKNVVRGLHFQTGSFAQGKLVRVIHGSVLDVAVDIRKNSPTFGDHVAIQLDGVAKHMLWIPAGFAHGFAALEDETIFAYKCTAPYHKASERTIQWNDKDLNIDWKIQHPVISEKDQEGTPFNGNWY